MGSFKKNFQQNFAAAAGKISAQRHLMAIRNGLMVTIPLTIIGGVALILSVPPVPKDLKATNAFFAFLLAWKSWAAANSALLITPYNMSIGLLGLFAVLSISYFLAKSYEMNPLSECITSFFTFIIICSPATAVLKDKPSTLFLQTDFLGAKGLFTAILVGLFTVEISRFMLSKNIKIRMPDSVPPMVSAPFEAMLPMFANIVIFMAINHVLVSTTKMILPQAIMMLFAPLISASDTLWAVISVSIVINILWFFGIHGGAIANAIILPFITLNYAQNAAAVASGHPATHIFAGGFFSFLVNIGGSGAALGMAVAMLIVAKSAQLRSLSKIGIVPVVFGISEPFVFGTPMIMNPYILFPMLFAPIVNAIISYSTTAMGLVGKFYVSAPNFVPGPLGAFLSDMDWRSIVLWCVLVAIDTLIYLPFVKAYDATLVKKEKEPAVDEPQREEVHA